jgi:hypothetical protein
MQRHEIALPDNLAQFEATQQGIDAATTESVIKVKLSRAVESATSVTLQLAATGLTYGTEFTTEPAASNNRLLYKSQREVARHLLN